MADEEATIEAASKAVEEWCQANPREHEPWAPPAGFGPVPERVVVSYLPADRADGDLGERSHG